MNRYLLIFIVTLAAALSFLPAGREYKSLTQLEDDSTVVVTFAAVGDLMCHSVQYNYAAEADGYNFIPFFEDIKSHLSEADFTFGNLETVMAGKKSGYSGYPFFNTPDEYLDALKYAGFDLLTTANNHSLDKGEKGLLRTIEQINERGIYYNGTFISAEDRDSIRIIDVNGIKTAFLAYTYGTNGIPVPKGKSYLINIIDEEKIVNDIKKARSKEPDIIILHYHFGEEYQREPNTFQKKIVDLSFGAGADIVIGGHPHVLQPLDFFGTSGKIDTGLVAYSLGNFFSNQRWRYSDAGAILYFQILKNFTSGEIKLNKVEILPTWVYKGNREFRILPLGDMDMYTFLQSQDKQKILQAYDDSRSILSKYSEKVLVKSIRN